MLGTCEKSNSWKQSMIERFAGQTITNFFGFHHLVCKPYVVKPTENF